MIKATKYLVKVSRVVYSDIKPWYASHEGENFEVVENSISDYKLTNLDWAEKNLGTRTAFILKKDCSIVKELVEQYSPAVLYKNPLTEKSMIDRFNDKYKKSVQLDMEKRMKKLASVDISNETIPDKLSGIYSQQAETKETEEPTVGNSKPLPDPPPLSDKFTVIRIKDDADLGVPQFSPKRHWYYNYKGKCFNVKPNNFRYYEFVNLNWIFENKLKGSILIDKDKCEVIESKYRPREPKETSSKGLSSLRHSNSSKPPLGVLPRYLHEETRMLDLKAAIISYLEDDKPVLMDWVEEYNELQEKIKMRSLKS